MPELLIKQIQLGNDNYDIVAKYLKDKSGNQKSWEDIVALANSVRMSAVVVDVLPTASANTMGNIYLTPQDPGSTGNVHLEYITVKEGAAEPYTYKWELVGSTAVDISNKADKGEYVSTSAGAHSHTLSGNITVPDVSSTTHKMGVSITDVAVAANGTASVISSIGEATKDSVLGADTTFTVSGGVATTKNIKATASGVAVGANGTDTFIKSITPTTQNLIVDEIPNISSESASVPTSVSVTAGSAATFTPVVTNGVLSFSFSGGTPTAVSVGENVSVPKLGTGTKSVVTGIGAAGTGAAVVTGLSNPTTATALTGVKVTAQPTVNLATSDTTGAGIVSVATGISAVSVSVGSNDLVNAVTETGTTSTETVLTGVKVQTQPTVSLDANATVGVDYVAAINTGTTTASVNGVTVSDAAGHTHSTTI